MSKASVKSRAVRLLAEARELVARSDNWATAYNALFGIGGLAGQAFASEPERVEFSNTEEFDQIMSALDGLRDDRGDPDDELAEQAERANGRILVRVPRSVHAALIAEAKLEGVSLNQLCLAKLAARLRILH